MTEATAFLLAVMPIFCVLGVATHAMTQPAKRAVEKRRARDLKVKANVRRTFPPEEALLSLARSVKKRQIHPLILLPGDVIGDGECRWRGMMLEDPDFEFDVICVDRELTPAEVCEIQMISAMHSTSLCAHDQAVACKEWMDANPSGTAKELAEKIDRDPSTVAILLSLWRCIPAVIKAAEEGKIGPKAWHQISMLPEAEQGGLLELYLSGMSAAQVAQIGRQKRKPAKPEDKVRVSKIKCPMPGGVVQVTGDDLSLSDMIGLLTELLKQARKSADEGCDAKAFMALLAARAKDKGKTAS